MLVNTWIQAPLAVSLVEPAVQNAPQIRIAHYAGMLTLPQVAVNVPATQVITKMAVHASPVKPAAWNAYRLRTVSCLMKTAAVKPMIWQVILTVTALAMPVTLLDHMTVTAPALLVMLLDP